MLRWVRHAAGALARRFYAGPVQNYLLLILLIVLAPVIALVISAHFDRLQDRQAAEFRACLELARATGVALDGLVHDILDQELAIGLALTSGSPESPGQISALLAANTQGSAALRRCSWLDPQGRVIASSEPGGTGADLSGRADVQQIRAGRDWAVSDLFLTQAGSAPVFAITRGFRSPSGELLGIVVAQVDTRGLQQALPIGPIGQGEVLLFDRQGRCVFRFPGGALTWAQRSAYQQDPRVARALAGQEATEIAHSPIDGVERMGALVPIADTHWVAEADRPVAEVLTPLQADLLGELVALALVGGGAMALTLVASRHITGPIERLRRHAAAVGQGEWAQPPVEAAPVELRELDAALNHTAEELRRRQEQREDILRAVSHDLRSPLTAILTQAELLQRQGLPGPQRSGAEAIVASARRMNVMIQDLVDSARLESGQLQLNRRPVDLYAFLQELKQRLAGAMDMERVQVTAEPGLPPVSADPDRLERILTNLISNALKYSAPGTLVTVALYPHPGELVTAVSDRGPGIPPADLPRLFQRYYRTEAGREQRGLGLGLYITRQLVEAHGGRIWVESRLGEGSTFAFSLPRERNVNCNA